MDNQESILAGKARRATGPVHRPSDATSNGDPPPAATAAAAEDAPGEEPVLPLSHHVSGDDIDNDNDEAIAGPSRSPPVTYLPPYSGPASSSQNSQSQSVVPKGPQYYPGLPFLDYRQYSPPMFDLSADTTTVTSKATYLSENVKALSSLLRVLATVPPKPQILVTGNRGRKVDFSIKLNLLNLLIPDDPKDRMDYLRVLHRDEMGYRGGEKPGLQPDVGVGVGVGEGGTGGLDEWCKRFVDDPSSVKSFTLERVVANLDTSWLEGQLRSLVATTEYKGTVSVTFPVTHSRVVVQTPDRVNKFFTSVSSLFSGRSKYEVVKAVWPFATARNGEAGRRCIVQSEKTWWDEWKDPIKYAIATKRHGWVTNEDKLECIMESKGKGLSIIDWGPDF